MHYTLLTDKERTLIHHEYRTRAAIIFCFVMAAVCIIGMAVLFPAYIFSTFSERDQKQVLVTIDTKKDNTLVTTKNELFQDSAILTATKQYVDRPRLSDIVAGIVGAMGPVKLTSLAIDTASSSVVVKIQGVAPTRTALLALGGRLESVQKGNVVDLPISELTKSTALDFSLKVTQKIQ
ncbi:MAG: hypothetical protein WCO48_03475 [Candidatus Taylorbacteria bacterium]